jgi:type II secretory pathway pseudopilin PulG
VRRAYLLIEAMIAIVIVGIVATVFTTMNFYTHMQSNVLKQQNSKIILEVVRSRLTHLAKDPDSDTYFELLKEESGNTLPISIGLGTDAWGKRIYYSTVDLGVANVVDVLYANTTTAISPNDNIAGRLVSSGEDMVLDTSATDDVAQGDDLMLEIGVGELNHFKLYGGSEITTQTRAYNSAIVSATAPLSPINGTLWYDKLVSKLKIYDSNTSVWLLIAP